MVMSMQVSLQKSMRNQNKQRSWLIGTLVSLLLQSGCATTLVTPTVKQEMPEKWRNATATQLKGSESKAESNWWRSLDDIMLNDMIALALKQNLSLAQANERLSAAYAIEKAKTASHHPQLNFSAGPNNYARALPRDPATHNSTTGAYLAGFELNWDIPLFDRAESQNQIAKASIQTLATDMIAAKNAMIAEVVRSYAELRAAQTRLSLFQSILAKYELLYQLSQQGQAVGLLSENEQINVQFARNEVENALLEANIQTESALQRLAVLCGLSTPQASWLGEVNPDWHLLHTVAPTPSLPAMLLQNRTDIKHAQALVLLAAGEAGIARADLYPKLAIEGALMVAGSLSGAHTANLFAFIAPSIRIPIIDWGLGREVVNAKDAKLREAILNYRETVLLAIEEVENALADFNAATQRLTKSEQLFNLSKDQSIKLQNGFSAGFLNRTELLNLEIKSQNQQLRYVDAKKAWLASFALVNQALSGMDTDLLESQLTNQQDASFKNGEWYVDAKK